MKVTIALYEDKEDKVYIRFHYGDFPQGTTLEIQMIIIKLYEIATLRSQ